MLSKKEHKQLIVVILCGLFIFSVYIVYKNIQINNYEVLTASEKNARNQVVKIGEQLVLNSAEDLNDINNGYTARFDFRGQVKVKVIDAYLYKNLDEYPHHLDLLEPTVGNNQYLVLNIEFTNDNAKPIVYNMFSASLFKLRESAGQEYSPIALSVPRVTQDPKKFFFFPVDIGKTEILTFVYEVSTVNNDTYHIEIGTNSSVKEKYVIEIPFNEIKLE